MGAVFSVVVVFGVSYDDKAGFCVVRQLWLQ